ncbi:hypothetical protein Ancab_013785 [Ancistrocladus abbreviatus]
MASNHRHTLLLSLSLTFPLLILTSALVSEPDVLLAFKSTIKDPSNSLSSWSKTSAVHHCNWTGITCTATLSVTSVNLHSLNLSGDLSPSICQLPSLSHLNVAGNSFNQPIPLHLSQCTSLKTLNLSNNLIWGSIPDQISQFVSLESLDFSRNHVEGKIPESIGFLKGLKVLNLGSNLLSGNIPLVFGNFSDLLILDLSQNPFLVSEIPSDIGNLEKLEQILLQNSGFYGGIPESFVGLKNLRVLDLSQNNLTGDISQTLGFSLKSLVSFDVSANKLTGSFPSEGLWALPKIKLIRAETNRFSGEVPDSISMAAQLEQVQIDNNNFSGRIPRGLGVIKSLYRFSASSNAFYGDLPPNFCDSPVMSIINLSHNLLSGSIPEVRKCRKLVSLSLAANSFIGGIPSSLGELPVLTYLDLSDNNLTGLIPRELQNLKLALFNVSFNQLSGEVPLLLISGLPASYLQGNPNLCGAGLPKSCSDIKPKHPSFSLSKTSVALMSTALAAVLVISAVGFFTFHRYSKRNSERGTWHSMFFYPLRISEQDLIMEMNEKTAICGDGALGRVHIIALPSGELVAVKKLSNSGSLSLKVLKAEIKTLAKIHHKNIAKILGFSHTDELIFLIYEYLPKGSLGDIIGKPHFQMQWSARLKIALGVAQGLAYLHDDYSPRILHRNLKSKNVLLDAALEPKLTDFALDRIVGESSFQPTLAFESPSSCYVAPEYGHSKRATEHMDIYSFGVVLLELVTGRQAEPHDSGEEPVDIVKWVRRRINISNGAFRVLDPRISDSSREEMLGALEIALRCTSVMPEKRPSMAQVVRALQSLELKSIPANA